MCIMSMRIVCVYMCTCVNMFMCDYRCSHAMEHMCMSEGNLRATYLQWIVTRSLTNEYGHEVLRVLPSAVRILGL